MTLVLIVDDHVSVARSLVKLLSTSGFNACAVHTGTEALEFLRSHDVALVLLDMSMPDMTGIEVLEALRVPAGQFPVPPIIMLSGDDDQPIRDEAARLGAVDFVSKVNPTRLLDAIEDRVRPAESARA